MPKLQDLETTKQLNNFLSLDIPKENGFSTVSNNLDKVISSKDITLKQITNLVNTVNEHIDDDKINVTISKLTDTMKILAEQEEKKEDSSEVKGEIQALMVYMKNQINDMLVESNKMMSSVNNSEYLSDKHKDIYSEAISSATSSKEIEQLKKISQKEMVDAEFLVKSLSHLKKSVTENKEALEDAGEDTSEILKSIIQVSANYNKTGTLDMASLDKLIDKVTSITDSKGSSIITMDSSVSKSIESFKEANVENSIGKTIDTTVEKFVSTLNNKDTELTNELTKQYEDGKLSVNEYIEKLDEINVNTEDLKKSIDRLGDATILKEEVSRTQFEKYIEKLSDTDKSQFDHLTEMYKNNESTVESYTYNVEQLLSKQTTSKEEKRMLSEETITLKGTLNQIVKNTDKETNKVSNAEKIKEQNRLDREQENQEAFRDAVDNMAHIKDDKEVKKSVLSGASSAEELGENSANWLMNKIGDTLGIDFLRDDDNPNKGRRRHRSRSRRSRGRRRKGIGGLISKVRGLFGGKVGAVTSLLTGGDDTLGLADTAASLLTGGEDTMSLVGAGAESLSGAGKAGGILGSILPKAGGMLSGLGSIAKFAGPAAAIAGTLYSAYDGVKNAGENLGLKKGQKTTLAQDVSGGLGGIVSGLSFGLIDQGSATRGIDSVKDFASEVGPVGTIRDLFTDDDSMKLAESLEDQGVVDLSVIGNSKVRNWDAIRKLDTKQLDALIRYDDWDKQTKTALEKIKKSKSEKTSVNTSSETTKSKEETLQNNISETSKSISGANSSLNTSETNTNKSKENKKLQNVSTSEDNSEIGEVEYNGQKLSFTKEQKQRLLSIRNNKSLDEIDKMEAKIAVYKDALKTMQEASVKPSPTESLVSSPNKETTLNGQSSVMADVVSKLGAGDFKETNSSEQLSSLTEEPEQKLHSLDNSESLKGSKGTNIYEDALGTIGGVITSLSPMGSLINLIGGNKTDGMSIPGLGTLSTPTNILPNIVKFFAPETSKETNNSSTSIVPNTTSGFIKDAISNVVSLSPMGALINSVREILGHDTKETISDTSTKMNTELSSEQKSSIDHYVSQGLTNPQMISLSTDIDPKLVSSYLQNSNMSTNGLNTPVPPKTVSVVKPSVTSSDKSNDTPIINSVISTSDGGSQTDHFRLIDKSLDILSQI